MMDEVTSKQISAGKNPIGFADTISTYHALE